MKYFLARGAYVLNCVRVCLFVCRIVDSCIEQKLIVDCESRAISKRPIAITVKPRRGPRSRLHDLLLVRPQFDRSRERAEPLHTSNKAKQKLFSVAHILLSHILRRCFLRVSISSGALPRFVIAQIPFVASRQTCETCRRAVLFFGCRLAAYAQIYRHTNIQ